MPDADGKIRGIALGGRAADAWLRIFGDQERLFDREPPSFDEQCEPRIPVRDKSGAVVAWAKCSPEDYDDLSQFRWHMSSGYPRRAVKKNTHERMHERLVGRGADHINRDRLDNRRANLRIVTHAENLQNHPGVVRTSKYRGVSWHEGAQKWEAGYMVDGKKTYLGTYETELAAAHAARDGRLRAMPYTVEPDLPLEVAVPARTPVAGEPFVVPRGTPVHSMHDGQWVPSGRDLKIKPHAVDEYGDDQVVVTWAGRGGYWRRACRKAGRFVAEFPS